VAEGKRFGANPRNSCKNLANVVGEPQRNGQAVAENAGVEVDLGKRADVGNDLFELGVSEHDPHFQWCGDLPARVREKLGHIARGPHKCISVVNAKGKASKHRLGRRGRACVGGFVNYSKLSTSAQ
jgi:hypothetical protein